MKLFVLVLSTILSVTTATADQRPAESSPFAYPCQAGLAKKFNLLAINEFSTAVKRQCNNINSSFEFDCFQYIGLSPIANPENIVTLLAACSRIQTDVARRCVKSHLTQPHC